MKAMKSIIGKIHMGRAYLIERNVLISPCITQGNPDKILRGDLGHQMNKNDLV